MAPENFGKLFNRRSFLQTGAVAALAGLMLGTGCARPTQPGIVFKPKAGERFALLNVKVVDVTAQRVLPDRAVIVQDGFIENVVSEQEVAKAGLPVMDCQGLYLTPGLINAHCHINMFSAQNAGLGNLPAILEQIDRNYEDSIAWGVTTIRDMGASPKLITRHRASIERGDRLGPHVLTALSVLTVPGGYPDFLTTLPRIVRAAVGDLALYAKNADQSRDYVKQLHDQGADLIKIALDHKSVLIGGGALNVPTDAQLEAIVSEAARRSLPVAAHHLYGQGFARGLAFGIDTMEHLPTNIRLTDEQIAQVVDSKTPFVPTLTSRNNLAFPTAGDPYYDHPLIQANFEFKKNELMADVPKHCSPKIHRLCQEFFDYFATEQYALPENRDTVAYDPKFFTRGVVMVNDNLSRMIEAGALIGVGNDAGMPLSFPGMLHFEMLLLTQAGMPPAQALRSATEVNAQICGIEDRCGTIAPGKRADLLLVKSNPLEDVRAMADISAVFKQGTLVSRSRDFGSEGFLT